jgi:hypothetical protein
MGNSLNEDLTGKVVFFKQSTLSVTAEEHPFLAEGGFGCHPHTSGTALVGTFLSDGEEVRMDGYMVERIASDEEVREFARANPKAQAILAAKGTFVLDEAPTTMHVETTLIDTIEDLLSDAGLIGLNVDIRPSLDNRNIDPESPLHVWIESAQAWEV